VVSDRTISSSASDDTALVNRCLAGERSAERELFRRERARVHATLYRVLGANRDLEDLVQEAFLEVFRSLGGFRGESRLSTWIDRIAVRVAYRYLSRRKPATASLEALPELEIAAGGGETDGRAAAREGVRRLYAALAELTPRARLAFALHVIEGRSIAEVARLTDSAVVATKVRIWRARRELERLAAADVVLAEFLGAEVKL
jgi:RNA polymerase sigma-70 factor, ECF subfamily